MKRGQIVIASGRGDFSTKPRPSLIVQADAFNAFHPAFTVCPITSHLTGDYLFRVPIAADAATGLDGASEIEVDRIQAIWRERIREVVGQAPDAVMAGVDVALQRWLSL